MFKNLDFTPIHSILWTGLHRYGSGRPIEYQLEWDQRVLMLCQLEQIPYVKDPMKRLKRNQYLRNVCGYNDKAPTEPHFSQMKRRIGAECFRIMETWLRRETLRLRDRRLLTAVGLMHAACLDGARMSWDIHIDLRHSLKRAQNIIY